MRNSRTPEYRSGFEISWEDRAAVLMSLRNGAAANLLVTQGLEVVLSMRSHKQIEQERGLTDDGVLLEGLVEVHGGRVFVDSSFHGASKEAERIIPDIENELSEAIVQYLH